MPAFTPPAATAVDFALASFTAPSAAAVDFELGGGAGPTIDTQPQSVTVVRTNTTGATFTTEATTSGGSLAFQWQRDTGSGFADLTGETTDTLTLTGLTTASNGYAYRCNVTDDNGTTATDGATLSVFDGPTGPASYGPTVEGTADGATDESSDYACGSLEFNKVSGLANGARVRGTYFSTAPA